ncbi:hypothetical protein MBLNU457_5946t1 [Dothideomycetes sp. NU457]
MANRSARKRQARLTFSPLPSSSPATSSYNQQIRDRAAAVSLDSPRAVKRRKLQDAPGIQTYLEPTSSATSATVLSSPEVANNTSRKSKPSTTTTTTFFGSQHSSQRGSQRPVKKKTKKQITVLDDSDDSESDEAPRATSHRIGHSQQAPVSLLNRGSQDIIRQSTRSQAVNLEQSDSDTASLPTTPLARTRPSAAARGDRSSPLQIDSDSDSDDVVPMRSSGRTRKRSSPTRDEDELPRSSARRTRPARSRGNRESPEEVESSVPAADTDSDDEEDMPRSSARRMRRARPRSDEEVSEEAEDEVVDVSSEEEEEEEDDPLPRRKRTLTRAEQQEIDDDLQDLKSSSPGTLDGRPRSSQRSKHASALEKLRRRRAGQQIVESEEEEEEQSDDDDITVVASSSRNMFRPDEDDEGFLEDDDNDTLGVPAGIPLKFTRYATSSAKDLFRYAVEWMVQKKLNPAFLMNDEIYKLTFDKLDDEVTGLAGSKFISAIWTPEFSLALRARPQIGMQLIDRGSGDYLRDKCDACNRTGHPATWEIQFLGKPYNKTSLEEIATKNDDDEDEDSDSDDSSDSDSDGGTHDVEGRQIPPQSKIFYVGKFCKANAETAHALTHWRWHLYDWVVDYLTAKGHNTPEMIVKRDSWSERKRRKRANKIVDAMEVEGKIKELYQDFKSQIKDARFSKQGRFDNSHE